MTKRLLPPAALLAATIFSVTGCPETPPSTPENRGPFVDEWRTELELPAEQFTLLSIGDRKASDNFANRGDIEVSYDGAPGVIKIEMQRFTIASSKDAAAEAWDRMQFWAYDIASPEEPADDNVVDLCNNPDPEAGIERCFIRAYYDGLFQPVRDGANFRVTVPAGWEGDLDIVTEDNLEAGIETYPDRSDVIVDGLNGNLTVDMDSGNVTVRMDPNIQHFAGCSNNQKCIDEGYAAGCGCSEPTNVSIANKNGQASNILVDVGNANAWYTMILENRGVFSSSDDFVCNATIDCGAFPNCLIDPAYANLPNQERADVNYPGDPAIEGAGMRISLISEACANILYVDGIEDYESDNLPEEKRGEIEVCVGCL